MMALMTNGLRQHDPALTFEQAGEFLHYWHFPEMLRLTTEAWVTARLTIPATAPTQDVIPLQEGVPLLLDRTRYLSLKLGPCYQAERETEALLNLPYRSVQVLRDLVNRKLSTARLLILLACGLRKDDPTLTMEQIGKRVFYPYFGEVFEAINTAWEREMTNPAAQSPAIEESATASPPSLSGTTSGVAPAAGFVSNASNAMPFAVNVLAHFACDPALMMDAAPLVA